MYPYMVYERLSDLLQIVMYIMTSHIIDVIGSPGLPAACTDASCTHP